MILNYEYMENDQDILVFQLELFDDVGFELDIIVNGIEGVF